MRSNITTVLSASNATAQNGPAIDANQLLQASFQIIPGATAVLVAKVQFSNDGAKTSNRSTFVPTNWTDIPSATVTNTANTSAAIVIANMAYSFIRVVYTVTTPGSGTASVQMCALGM